MKRSSLAPTVIAAALMLSAGFGRAEVSAQSQSYMNIPEQMRLANEARQLWWNSLSPRERTLVRAVGRAEQAHTEETGEPYIPVTDENVVLVMQLVDAEEGEAGFVRERLQVHARAAETIADVDTSLEYMRQNPYWYLPPSMRP